MLIKKAQNGSNKWRVQQLMDKIAKFEIGTKL